MKQSPKDKMIKTSPKKKEIKPKGKEVKKEEKVEEVDKTTEAEVEIVEPELTAKEKKDVQVIQKVIVHDDAGNPFDKLSRAQIELIKTQVAKGATDDELKLFITVCRNAKLDPFVRQVHFVKRWDSKLGRDVGIIQVGIDGFRSIAEMSERYAGSDDAVYKDEHEETLYKEVIKLPGSATVTVYKLMDNGERYPFTATARWSEYYPGDRQGYMWRKMPFGQLGKCAEALALRKAFPKLLSGLYAPEEMDQGGASADPQAMIESAYQKAKAMINRAMDKKGLEDLKGKVDGSKKYNATQKKDLIATIEARIKELK